MGLGEREVGEVEGMDGSEGDEFAGGGVERYEGGREGGGGGQRWMKEKAMSVEGERWKTPKERGKERREGEREGKREGEHGSPSSFKLSLTPPLPLPLFPSLLLLDHGKALLLRLQWGASRSGSSLNTTLRLSLDELKSQGKGGSGGREGEREGGREGGRAIQEVSPRAQQSPFFAHLWMPPSLPPALPPQNRHLPSPPPRGLGGMQGPSLLPRRLPRLPL